jgi:hypothetical protein
MQTQSIKDNYNTLLKHGSYSIILGKHYYIKHFPEKPNKVLKITNDFCGNIESRYQNIISSITNYESYYAISEAGLKELTPDSAFYKYLKNMFKKRNVNIFTTNLSCFYVDYAGSMDVLDSIEQMCNEHNNTIWRSYDSILNFAIHVMKGLSYLHEKKICHLDIKPENVMIDTQDPNAIKFRIIDFGFSSMEPFRDYIENIRGTPCYFPKCFKGHSEPGLSTIYANDMIADSKTGFIPMKTNPKLVYKIDSYCLGRMLNYLLYYYNETFNPSSCFQFLKKINKPHSDIKQLIASLTINDVHTRPLITTLLYDKQIAYSSII